MQSQLGGFDFFVVFWVRQRQRRQDLTQAKSDQGDGTRRRIQNAMDDSEKPASAFSCRQERGEAIPGCRVLPFLPQYRHLLPDTVTDTNTDTNQLLTNNSPPLSH